MALPLATLGQWSWGANVIVRTERDIRGPGYEDGNGYCGQEREKDKEKEKERREIGSRIKPDQMAEKGVEYSANTDGDVKVKKTRASRPKVKTGCQTCKFVKCISFEI